MLDHRGEGAYDTIVVGSGAGGISAAALMAKAGMRVLVVEQADGPGGYTHVFRRGNYVCNPAVHTTGELRLFDGVLRHLDVREHCTLLPLDRFYTVILPGFELTTPFGMDEYVEAHARHFPHEADGIRRFFGLSARIRAEAHDLPASLTLRELGQALDRLPTVVKYRRATLGAVLDEYLTDPRARAVCAAPWIHLGLPPSKLAFMPCAQWLFSQLGGAFACRGSFQSLIDALVAALEQNGGRLLLRARVSRIMVEDGRVTGVLLTDGRQIRAPVVVSNADARRTFEDLVGTEHLPQAFMDRFRRLKPSLSAYIVYAASRLDLPRFKRAELIFCYPSWDHEDTFRRILEGEPRSMMMNVTTGVDPSLAPPGEHVIVVTAPMPYDIGSAWEDQKPRYTEMLLANVDAVFPGFRDQLTFIEGATPLTLERYSLNWRGAMYGWEQSPHQTASKRPGHRTRVSGLYLSGHWTQSGGGLLRAFVSGVHVAQMVQADTRIGDPVPSFTWLGLPPA